MADINRDPYSVGDRKTQYGGGPGGQTGSDAADLARRMRAIDPEDPRPLKGKLRPGRRLA